MKNPQDGVAPVSRLGAVGAIVAAAGESRRMGGADKQFAPVGGRPLLWRCLDALHRCADIDAVALVLSERNLEAARAMAADNGWRKVRAVTTGGPRRQDSVRRGLETLGPCEWVIVHDGARPFVDASMVARGLDAARETGAAAAAVPVKDTIKLADAAMNVVETLPRDRLWAVQTPQVFRRELLAEAHRRVSEDVTDDAAMVERIGVAVKLFHGSYSNLKVTTPEDVTAAESILRERERRGHGAARP